MQKYVIINLAQPDDGNPVGDVRSAMQLRMVDEMGEDLTPNTKKEKRMQMEVPIHCLINAHLAILQGRPADAVEDIALARDDCLDADKIILCMHGYPDDVDHFFADGNQSLGDVDQLASFMKRLLVPDKLHRVSLAMCYGARTRTYLPDELDAQGPIAPGELASSFAYKFFKAMHSDPDARRMVMTARTGAMGYRALDGMSEVEQEAALNLRLLIRKYADKAKATNWRNMLAETRKRNTPKSTRRAHKFIKIDQKFRYKPTRFAFKPAERVAKRYYGYIKKQHAVELARCAYPNIGKYGKIVYRCDDDDEVSIIRKYTDGQKTRAVLYQGQWL